MLQKDQTLTPEQFELLMKQLQQNSFHGVEHIISKQEHDPQQPESMAFYLGEHNGTESSHLNSPPNMMGMDSFYKHK